MAEYLKIENSSGVAVIEINRPKVNALSRQVLQEIGDGFRSLYDDLPRVAILWGGPNHFAAGADISEFGTPEQGREMTEAFRYACDEIANFPRVTIAAISGYALGGGAEVALACDLRVMQENAKIGFPEVSLGIIPGGGATQRLPRIVGLPRTLDLLLTGRTISAEEALQMGLCNFIADDLFVDTLAWADQFAKGPSKAYEHIKQLVKEAYSRSLNDGLNDESFAFSQIFGTQDAQTGLTSFKENGPGKAEFKGN